MGICFGGATFEDHAPTLDAIIAKMTELGGVRAVAHEVEAIDDGWWADIEFDGFPESAIEVWAQRRYVVFDWGGSGENRSTEATERDDRVEADQKPTRWRQKIELKGFLTQDLTLLHLAQMALAEFGPVADAWSDDARAPERIECPIELPIDVDELRKRYAMVRKAEKQTTLAGILLLPFIVLFFVLSILVALVAWIPACLGILVVRLWQKLAGRQLVKLR